MGLKFLNFELYILYVINCKKINKCIGNQQCNEHMHCQHEFSRIFLYISIPIFIFNTFQGPENFYIKFQDFPYFSRICTNPEISTFISCSRSKFMFVQQSLNCHGGAVVVFHKPCRTTWSTTVYTTESVSVMGHVWSAAVCSTGSIDQRQRSFVNHISSFWSVVLPDRHVLWNRDVSDSQRQIPVRPSWQGRSSGKGCQRSASWLCESVRCRPTPPALPPIRSPIDILIVTMMALVWTVNSTLSWRHNYVMK